jgi:opacity protein-like surface antigen
MKKLAVVMTLALSFSISGYAENIDGTLAVDSNNQLSNVKQSAQASLSENSGNTHAQLSAGMDSAGDSMKATEPVSTVPVPTGGSSILEGPFVGLEGNFVTSSSTNDGIDSSGISFGLRFGAQNVDWRTMAIIERFPNNDEANNYTRGLLQLDYFFLGADNLMLDTYGIRPYAGLNAGIISLNESNKNVKSLTYGAQLGGTMNLTNNIDFDLGYRYNLSSSDSIDHTSGITAGIHYKY